jgi:hypothetical protein
LTARLRSEGTDHPVISVSARIRVSPPAGTPLVAKPFDAEHLLATIASLLAGF